jgi:TonB family protein
MSQMYDLYFSDGVYSNQNDSSKYFGISIFFHIALALGVATLSVPMLQKINEPITIEMIERAPLPPVQIKPLVTEVSRGEKVLATRGAKKISAPRASSLLMAPEADVIKASVAKSKSSRAKMATLKTTTGGGKALVAKSAPSRAGVPETIEDIAAPQLDFESVEVAQQGLMGTDELESEFKNIDQKSEAALRAQKSAMDAETKMISDEQDQALAALENETKLQARAMDDALSATRTKNAAALAQIKASEQAAAERAAREEFDRRKSVADAAAAARGSGAQGRGQGQSGADAKAIAAAGSPNAVRSVDSLRQLPGNPKPQYATDERLRREQGKVIFYAFVTPQGRLENFKLMQTTGYKNLDSKSLAALKKWKFYPGQQGWVEIPQVWSLKGDVEKMPTLLRRQVSQR